MPTPLDFAFLFLITVVFIAFDALVFFPRFKEAALRNEPGVRPRAYRRTTIAQWACAAAAIAIWVRADRPWRDLGLVPPGGLRLWASAVLVIVVVALSWQQARAIGRASRERLAELRDKLGGVEFLLPHTRGEARGFAALSVTAGVCEELLYRGFLVWVLKPWVGVVGALALGVLLFAVGHAYQGWRGMLKTGAAGAVMSGVVLGTGWLIPAMVLHALVDLNAGILGFAVLEQRDDGGTLERSLGASRLAER